jgi:HEAT repeat protein
LALPDWKSARLIDDNTRMTPHTRLALALTTMISASAVAQEQPRPEGTMTRDHVIMPEPRRDLPPVPPLVQVPIDQALQARARDVLADAFASRDPVLRAQALEASMRSRDPELASRVRTAMRDPESLVRFAGAMAAGDAKLREVYPSLLQRVHDLDEAVQVATRYALHRLGDRRFSQQLPELAMSAQPSVRANVALVLGKLGEPSALSLLRPMLEDPNPSVRLQAAEAIWRLNDRFGLETLLAGAISPFSDEQTFCTLALAQPRRPEVREYLLGRLAAERDRGQLVEVQLAAARGLGMLRSDAGFGLALDHVGSDDARRRVMAALALGDIARPDAQSQLAPLLNDTIPEVRLAAATALLQIGAAR